MAVGVYLTAKIACRSVKGCIFRRIETIKSAKQRLLNNLAGTGWKFL